MTARDVLCINKDWETFLWEGLVSPEFFFSKLDYEFVERIYPDDVFNLFNRNQWQPTRETLWVGVSLSFIIQSREGSRRIQISSNAKRQGTDVWMIT